MTDMTSRIWAFTVYTICMQSLLWIPPSLAVFVGGYSGWWMAVPILLSGSQFKPARFGITIPSANYE